MAISQQDLFVNLLLPNKNGFFLDIGAGDGESQPCQTNTAWLEELGWKGILLEYEKKYCDHAKKFRKNSIVVQGDAYAIDYRNMFRSFNAPTAIDYLSVDIDPWYSQIANVQILSFLPWREYDFKIITIEHDLYNTEVGKFQKPALANFFKNEILKDYKIIAEDVGLVYDGKKYLEDWFINIKYIKEFNIKNIENLYYLKENPNNIIMDLCKKQIK